MKKPKRSGEKPVPSPAVSEVGAGAPDPARCRARELTSAKDLADCLVEPLPACKFLLSFGNGGFCQHPERDRIIARTRERQPAGSS